MSTNKNVSQKNLAFMSLSFIQKLARTISNILKIEPSIFWALTLVYRTWRSSFDAYTGVIVLTLLSELIKACTLFVSFWKQNR